MPTSHLANNQSVTVWISTLRNGDQAAASKLWNFLYHRMRGLAAGAVARTRQGVYDEDDIANSAIAKLFCSIQEGRYSELEDRESLWKLAAVITMNKAKNRARDGNAARRGRGFLRSQQNLDELLDVSSMEQDPAMISAVEEECQKLIAQLQRDEVKMVALLKVEGFTNDEIAEHLGCTRRSVQRRLKLIRDTWSRALADD